MFKQKNALDSFKNLFGLMSISGGITLLLCWLLISAPGRAQCDGDGNALKPSHHRAKARVRQLLVLIVLLYSPLLPFARPISPFAVSPVSLILFKYLKLKFLAPCQ
jgi:hypothetical protein